MTLKLEEIYKAPFAVEDYFIDLRDRAQPTLFSPKIETKLDQWKQKNGARGLMPKGYEYG